MKNKIIAIVSLFTLLFSCQRESEVAIDDTQQNSAITGLLTRSSLGLPPATNYNIGITTMLRGVPYFMNAAATMAATTGNITFNGTQWFYPLNKDTLQFYAYSLPVSSNKMVLTSGNTYANDAILSNNNTLGTPGSSKAQITQLLFSHVMTKVDVFINITDPDLLGWSPSTFNFKLAGVVGSGNYSIISPPGAFATNQSGVYDLKLGTNYLVPTGATLSGNLSSLVIDNYTATTADLANFKVTPIAPATAIVLNPGQAYTITFTINRLQLQGVTVSLGNWQNIYPANDAVTYVPKTLNLNSGSYVANDINEIEITDNSNNIFAGSVANGVATFLLAPTTAKTVKLYTTEGLLVTIDNPSLNGTTLDLGRINAFGMLPLDPSKDYDPVTNRYAVNTAEQFRRINGTQTYNYIQTANLNFDMVSMPSAVMLGSFNGNKFQVLNVNVVGSGLFERVTTGNVVEGVCINSGKITQSGSLTFLGGICGENNGTVVGCVNETTISSAKAINVGGICGTNNGQVIACTNLGNLFSLYGGYMGGICGYNSYIGGQAVVSCLNTGMIKGTDAIQAGHIGGICGSSVSNAIFATSYWLTGTAAPTIGAAQVGVNGTSLTMTDLADLSPQRIREASTLTNLTNAIPVLWNSKYTFSMTNSVWPLPVII